MNISFKKNDPVNSVVFDTETGEPLYEINTPWSFGSGKTHIRRICDGKSPMVCQVDWAGIFAGDKLQIVDASGSGKWIAVDKFLSKDGIFNQ